ncbi:NADH-quinone oxidoreductase [Thermus scotoductus]|uniref:NADH-quinone oxidoreductase subunit J n=1 Tax=Thermus scotoductus TaxID=37636 RepID=A0A430UVJ5_THESC|nr:NADH-quinone oxidoreductase subunit J [Thermus scotoductus]RTG96731.1 NADH-quinone oxidoreductase [Thermus scotoductus]RTG97193.1 NADH-quinone oxidoreductase [Thermus scotoductus]RTH09577.1 NADH-quinone oxidoreductase [Thermus scotoductus]RTH12083.1 NADH-quinone oxidoreductase [Thermus scotoductus]RTH13920.1 NADH-quinone oxidoreductase [Thermus scotoductus]
MSPLEALALLALLFTGVLVVTLKNAIHAALALIGNFLILAGIYVALEARFLGFIQIIVYAGAIVVLFLFVIMILYAAQGEVGFDPLARSRPLALLLSLGVALVLLSGLWGLNLAFTQDLKGGLPQALGPLLYGDWLGVLLAVGFLLMVATVVAVALVQPTRPLDALSPEERKEEKEVVR